MRPPIHTSKIISDKIVTEMRIVCAQKSSRMLIFFEGKYKETRAAFSASRPLDYICHLIQLSKFTQLG